MGFPRLAFSLSCAVLLAAAASVHAISYVMVDDADLVRQAAAVVDARVVSVTPASTAGRSAIDYEVRVERWLAGSETAGSLVVRVPGGVGADGLGFFVYGAPRLETGERAILFLAPRRDGTFGLLHLGMGAFHRVEPDVEGGPALAVRDLSPGMEVVMPGVAVEPRRHQARDFEAFADWIVALGREGWGRRPADYFVAGAPGHRAPPPPPVASNGLGEKFTLFTVSGHNLRWFDFDDGFGVPWGFHQDGQPGLAGGGATELQAALASWNDDPVSEVAYTYAGTTSLSNGLDSYDGVNTVLPDDPNGEISGTFQCGAGGVLAIGGPWFSSSGRDFFQGVEYVEILGADVVMNDGIECLAAFTACFDESATRAATVRRPPAPAIRFSARR